MTPKQTERFWSNVDKSGDCWLWTGALTREGYGTFKCDGKHRAAHRVSFALSFGGERPRNVNICHRCDNRRCVRPTHLFPGSHVDNMRDMVAKGRSTHGEKNPSAKLMARDVEVIMRLLAAGVGQRVVAEAYQVATSTIAHIATGRIWKRVTGANNPRSEAA